jgi:aspartyl-tRNA(Asn)/glutamyl-tRNA(Gln) amidotransferase subunit A
VSDLGELNLVEAAQAIRDREVSPVELTEHYLARIEETEPAVHAYVTVAADRARAEARRAEGSEPSGPLHGVPLGVKDLFDTAGLRTTYGSPAWEAHVPEHDAAAVAALRRAGAIILGKHATHELAWGGRTDSAHFGPTHNPHRRGHIAGGSSGGSAASVVVGSSLGAIGTDTAGSVRIPAALSGCVGFKPTRGRIGLAGAMPLAPSLDHVGSLARTVADAGAIVDAIGTPVTAGAGTPRVCYVTGWPTDLLDPGVAGALAQVRSRLPGDEVPLAGAAPTEAVLTRILAEAGARHRPDYQRRPDLFGADLAALLELPAPTAADLARAEVTIAAAGAELHAALGEHDVLVLPTVPVPAPALGAMDVDGIPVELVLTRLTSIFDATGLPAVSVPAGLADGLPVGVQVVARAGEDAVALEVAARIERTAA